MTDDDHSLAAAYVLGALDEDERVSFERHLDTCDVCALDVREMAETTARFAQAEAEPPPDDLRRRVLDLATRTPQAEPPPNVVPLRRSAPSRANRWLAGVAAAAIVVAGALSVTTFQANQRADELRATASQVNAILADPASQRSSTEVAGGGTGTFIASRENEQGVLVTAGIAGLDPDQTYQLWAIDDAGAESIGLYDVDSAGDGTALVTFPETATTFGMTIEPAEGSPEPTTDPVLLLPIDA